MIVVGPPRVLAAALLAMPIAGQRPEWRLPERSAAVYGVRAVESGTRRQTMAIGDWAPMLLEGELAPERDHLAALPGSVLELVPYLAFDLRGQRGGRLEFDLPADGRDGAQHVHAEYSRAREATTQTIRAELTSAERGMSAVQATIRIDRTFDPAQGIVDHFRARIELGGWTRTEEWAFDRIERDDTPRFRIDVGQAIEDGADHLVAMLGRGRGKLAGQFDPGRLALMLYTLFKAGRGLGDPRIANAWDDLKKREIVHTYDLACAILAMDALHTPQGERDAILRGDIDGPQPRALAPDELEVLQGWTDRLLENGDHTVDVAYLRRWRYGRNDGYDNSNTQYALLGLYAALLCGAKVSRTVWFAAIEHELDDLQDADGRPRRLDVMTHRELELDRRNPHRTVTASRAVEPGAWGYVGQASPTGSMTSAGVAALAVCEAALRHDHGLPAELSQKVRLARSRGLLWLSDHLTVRFNPGDASWRSRLYYWLYSLERACEFLQIAWLDGRDWYFEGAMQLLLTRDPNRGNAWPSVTDTCFAVLFLKKAAYGPITGR